VRVMWRRKRGAQTATVERPEDDSARLLVQSEQEAARALAEFEAEAARPLVELEAEIEELEEANRAERDGARERRLLSLRHVVGLRYLDEPTPDPGFAAPARNELRSGDPLPEVSPAGLTPGLLRAGILRDGCVLVRSLIDRDVALELARGIDRAYEDRQRRQAGTGARSDYYEEFTPHPRCGAIHRPWIEQGGGLLAADSPRLHFEMMDQLRRAGLRELVSQYLGEPALISVHKTTLRRAEPSVAGAWHQDGYFMGQVRSLNLWLSLSRCGDQAPGLDIVPRRLEHYLASTSDDSPLDYTISADRVEAEAGDTGVIRPIFEPGDALFFDEWFLHSTGSDPSMPNPRYAIENWFFGASGFPEDYAPIAV